MARSAYAQADVRCAVPPAVRDVAATSTKAAATARSEAGSAEESGAPLLVCVGGEAVRCEAVRSGASKGRREERWSGAIDGVRTE